MPMEKTLILVSASRRSTALLHSPSLLTACLAPWGRNLLLCCSFTALVVLLWGGQKVMSAFPIPAVQHRCDALLESQFVVCLHTSKRGPHHSLSSPSVECLPGSALGHGFHSCGVERSSVAEAGLISVADTLRYLAFQIHCNHSPAREEAGSTTGLAPHACGLLGVHSHFAG